MIAIPKLEMHVIDACNLRCTGCTHYADHGLRGAREIATATTWLTPWSSRVAPLRFSALAPATGARTRTVGGLVRDRVAALRGS